MLTIAGYGLPASCARSSFIIITMIQYATSSFVSYMVDLCGHENDGHMSHLCDHPELRIAYHWLQHSQW